MVKKAGLVITMSVVLILSILNVFLFVNGGEISYNAITGKIIGGGSDSGITGRLLEEIPKFPIDLNISLVAFAIQWIILLVIAIVAYVRYMKKRTHEDLKLNYSQLSKRRTQFETDFDTFYELLKEKERLRMSVIAKVFEISEEQALEWSKILEDNDLVTIEYPAFYEPETRIIEKAMKKDMKKGEVKKAMKKDIKGKDIKKEIKKGDKKEVKHGEENKEEQKQDKGSKEHKEQKTLGEKGNEESKNHWWNFGKKEDNKKGTFKAKQKPTKEIKAQSKQSKNKARK